MTDAEGKANARAKRGDKKRKPRRARWAFKARAKKKGKKQ